MTSTSGTLLAPPPVIYQQGSPKSGGILLNAYRSSAFPYTAPPCPVAASQHYPPRQPSPLPPSPRAPLSSSPHESNSSSERDNDAAAALAGTPSRKIRFAPLPDPRRSVAVTDDGVEHQLDEDYGTIGYDGHVDDDDDEAALDTHSLSSDDDIPEGVAVPKTGRPRKGSWSSASKKLLSPLLGLPGLSPTKGGGITPSEDDGRTGATLSRRTSTGGLFGANPLRTTKEMRRKEELLGSQLRPVISAGSDAEGAGNRNHRRNLSADTRILPGQKMLNGRVYGSQRIRNAQKKLEEPEFNEWGYGGMGSVGAVKGSGWGKVGGTSQYNEDDDNDGSGMGWVRKRRRERELKEQQEREKKQRLEAQEEQSEKQLDVPAAKVPSAHHTPTASLRTTPTASTVSSRAHSPQPSMASGATARPGETHHYTTVALPAPVYHHGHHHHHHGHHGHGHSAAKGTPIQSPVDEHPAGAGGAAGALNMLGLALPAETVGEAATATMSPRVEAPPPTVPTVEVESSDSESSSDEDEEEEDEGGKAVSEGGTVSDSESETEEETKRRLTSASAGVEKVSTKGRTRAG